MQRKARLLADQLTRFCSVVAGWHCLQCQGFLASIQAKGFMILGGLFRTLLAPDHPMAFSASIAFEQALEVFPGKPISGRPDAILEVARARANNYYETAVKNRGGSQAGHR